MTPEERIARHRAMIEHIRDDIEWIRSTGFSMGGRDNKPGLHADDLIAKQEQNIAMYEAMIANLEGGRA